MNSNNGQDSRLDPKTEAGMRKLINRMPERQIQIEQLVEKDHNFREICQDFGDVSRALAGLRQGSSPNGPKFIADYKTLLKELEYEALSRLWT